MAKPNVNALHATPEVIESGNRALASAAKIKSAEHYVFEVVETASLGKSAVDDTLLYWDALKELTSSTNGLNDRERLQRLNAIAGLVTVGQRFAYDMSSLMESVHREHQATYNELLSPKGAA